MASLKHIFRRYSQSSCMELVDFLPALCDEGYMQPFADGVVFWFQRADPKDRLTLGTQAGYRTFDEFKFFVTQRRKGGQIELTRVLEGGGG